MNQEQRIRKLEWFNRFWVVCLVSVLVYGFTTRVVPAKGKTEKVIRAERVEIMGEQGEPAVILGFDEQGSGGLFINDPGGSIRVALAHDSDGSALFIRDSHGVVRIGVAQFAHGGGGVALHGPNSEGAAVLYFKESGSLSFYDALGNATLRVPEQAAGQ